MSQRQGPVAAHSDSYAFGDGGAAEEVGMPTKEIRKMRRRGLLAGAFMKLGHRSLVYHRGRLRRRIDEAFEA